MDRRSLLKSAAAIPAALVPAASAPATDLIQTGAPATPIAPVSMRPYANYVWEWFVSNDGETYYEGFATKEEAVQYAQQSDYCLVAECIKQDFDLHVDSYLILEHINDSNMELIGEGEGVECTQEQANDLEKMVTRAVEAWVVKHNINLTAWSFAGVKNKTEIEY